MRKTSLALLFISVTIPGPLLIASPPAAAGGPAQVEAAWLKAMKANDLEAVVACYAKDAVLWAPGAPEADGIEEIRATLGGMLGANTVKEVGVSGEHTRVSGDVGAGWGHFTLTIVPKAGGPDVAMHGRFTEVVEKRNGKWLYVADHASEDPPEMPAH